MIEFQDSSLRKTPPTADCSPELILEPMADFFAARTEGYDQHMLANVEGCKEAYPLIAQLIPKNAARLLDLGCGTGLELDYILPHFPKLQVMGIDLSESMLDVLRRKHLGKNLQLICKDYFSTDFGTGSFDCAVSVESLHHFSKERKLALYRRIEAALISDGCYIECDYMVDSQAEEDFYFTENTRLRQIQGISEDAYIHYDTPCTVENQMSLLREAGFTRVEHLFRKGGTSLILATK